MFVFEFSTFNLVDWNKCNNADDNDAKCIQIGLIGDELVVVVVFADDLEDWICFETENKGTSNWFVLKSFCVSMIAFWYCVANQLLQSFVVIVTIWNG